VFGLLFAIQIPVAFLPGSWADQVGKFLPATAEQAIATVHPDPAPLAPWTGFGVLYLYAAVVLPLAAQRMRHGDA